MKPIRPIRRQALPPAMPVGGLLDPRFVYRPPGSDIRETFRRVLAERRNGSPL